MGNHAEPIDAVGPHLSVFCSPLSLLDHILPYFVSRAYLPGMKPDAQIAFRPEESASGKETGMQASWTLTVHLSIAGIGLNYHDSVTNPSSITFDTNHYYRS